MHLIVLDSIERNCKEEHNEHLLLSFNQFDKINEMNHNILDEHKDFMLFSWLEANFTLPKFFCLVEQDRKGWLLMIISLLSR